MKFRFSYLYVLLGIAALALIFHFEFDLVPGEEREGADPKVLTNPLYAAGALLRHEGYVIHAAPTMLQTPQVPGTVISRQPLATLGNAGAEELLGWVAAGNQLITEAPPLWVGKHAPADPILGPLGVQRREPPEPTETAAKASTNKNAAAGSPASGEYLQWMQMPDSKDWLELGFHTGSYLDDSAHRASTAIMGAHGAQLLIYPLGRGQIVVLSDFDLFNNQHIGEGDNAALLLHLVNAPPGGRISIYFERSFPSLQRVLWDVARPACIAALAFTLCWLWWGSRRFGPLQAPLHNPRRRLAEHLQATGTYLWHAGGQKPLYEALRLSLRQHLLQRHSDWREMPMDALVLELAERSQLAPAQIRQALQGTPTADSKQFLADVQVISILRRLD